MVSLSERFASPEYQAKIDAAIASPTLIPWELINGRDTKSGDSSKLEVDGSELRVIDETVFDDKNSSS